MKSKDYKNIYKTEILKSKSTESLKPLQSLYFLMLLCSEQHTSVRSKKVTILCFVVTTHNT